MSAVYRPLQALFLIAALTGCGDGAVVGPDVDGSAVVASSRVVLNPTGLSPLAARVELTTTEPVSVEVTVPGRDGPETDVRHRFEGVATTHRLPVLGLYPNSENEIVLAFTSTSGQPLGRTSLSVTTAPLPPDMPQVRIDVPAGDIAPGMNLVNYYGHNSTVSPQRPFMFDRAGRIRWLLTFSASPALSGLFFDNGIKVLANGNLFFGDKNTDAIYEVDRLGTVVRQWPLPGYGFHHSIAEKPNGNFVVTVDKLGAATVEDYLIEIDRASGAIVTEWSLNRSLQATRRAWPTSLANLDVDWFHANAVVYDPTDDTIIVSGRTQGVVKLTRDNRVVWILAPHKDWGRAGDGTDLTGLLLQPLDAAGRPITDPAVLRGDTPHPDFEWAWYQHSPTLMPDGRLMLFDNGENRHYGGQGLYSRAVVYRIDASARTIRQVWQYGKERGTETFSRIVSGADFLAPERNVLFMPGSVRSNGDYGKMVEVDYDTRQVVFEATVLPPIAPFGVTFHRVLRVPMYPPGRAAGDPPA